MGYNGGVAQRRERGHPARMCVPKRRAGQRMGDDEMLEPVGRVSRTFRAAMRIGEDYITLEETIALPLDADDAEIARAVELGWRIYRAQWSVFEREMGAVREAYRAASGGAAAAGARDAGAPASKKQRAFVADLQDELGWSSEQVQQVASEQGIADMAVLTRGQASNLIERLKQLVGERTGEANAPGSATPRQQQALGKLAHERGLDLAAEVQQRYGVAAEALTFRQAGELIVEWQAAPRRGGGS